MKTHATSLGASLLVLTLACEAPGERSAQDALASIRVLRASGKRVEALQAATKLRTGYPETKAATAAKAIEDELTVEIQKQNEEEVANLRQQLAEMNAQKARVAARIGASGALLAGLNQRVDDMKNMTWYNAKGEHLVLGSWVKFYFGISRKGSEPSLLPLRMVVQLEDSDWVFAKTATFRVDGTPFEVRSDDWQHQNSGGTVWETADLPLSKINPELMRALANSSAVKVRFEGRTRVKDINVSQTQLSMMKRVYQVWSSIASAATDNHPDSEARTAVQKASVGQ
jgi:hypothetical protein